MTERSLALFVLGLLVFNPPLLSIFSGDAVVAGIPVLYLYFFAAWFGLIGLMAVTVRFARRSGGDQRSRRRRS